MNLYKLFRDNLSNFVVILVIVLSIQECNCLCGNSFSNATSLIVIDGVHEVYVANKCVKDLPIEKFQLLSKTKVIYAGTFSNLFHLHTIELNNCGITKVEPGFFENSPLVETIKIEMNNLEFIERYIFEGKQLNALEMSTNNMQHISSGAFQNSRFQYLCLSNNKFASIHAGWFRNTTITALSITHNSITNIDEDTLSGIRGLKTLKLSYNRIQSIHNGAFSYIETLQIVHLPGNMLEKVNFEIKHNLRNIDISFNRISYLLLDYDISLWTMSIYPNPFECSCLRKFWKYISDKKIPLRYTRSLRYPWKEEYPLCIAKFSVCNPKRQTYEEIQADYFKLMDYEVLGRPKYDKQEDFLDLGIVN